MTSPAIRVEQVTKLFQRGERHDLLRDMVASRLIGRRRRSNAAKATFRAVDDVSFDVVPGEAFGIIGPNGAGKSTLLKLLAGILRPDAGAIETRGRVSALIELGAGFHGDLTGRENIYLNASILGMRRRKVAARFDEIVEFSGIGAFLDTRVMRYSSGMHARLGFAIAVHVDPQVLLVDEVLSVGDRVFRARCMEKMREFLRRGVAIVFVSHDLATVGRFCDRTLVLSHGRTLCCGDTAAAVRQYYDACAEPSAACSSSDASPVNVSGVTICDADGRPTSTARPGETIRFTFDVTYRVPIARPSFGLSLIRCDDHVVVYETSSTRLGAEASSGGPGARHRVHYTFLMNVPPGEYAVGLHVRDRDALQYAASEPHAARLIVVGQPQGTGYAHLAPVVEVASVPARQRLTTLAS